MITRIKTPEALNHSLMGGEWPPELVPITVHFRKRVRRRRVNATEVLTRLHKLPPCIRYQGSIYLPDPKTPGGPFQGKHTEQEYIWVVKAWIKAPDCFDPVGQLSIKPVAVCADCQRVWTGTDELCPPCRAKDGRGALRPSTVGRIGYRKTDPPPDSEEPEVEVASEPVPDTQSSPGSTV